MAALARTWHSSWVCWCGGQIPFPAAGFLHQLLCIAVSQRGRRAARKTRVAKAGGIFYCPNLLRGSAMPQRSHPREMGVAVGGFTVSRHQILICPPPAQIWSNSIATREALQEYAPGKLAALQDCSSLNRPKQITPKAGPDVKLDPGPSRANL